MLALLSNGITSFALKEAIARDVDAINFVENIAKQNEGSQKAMKKLTDGGASV